MFGFGGYLDEEHHQYMGMDLDLGVPVPGSDMVVGDGDGGGGGGASTTTTMRPVKRPRNNVFHGDGGYYQHQQQQQHNRQGSDEWYFNGSGGVDEQHDSQHHHRSQAANTTNTNTSQNDAASKSRKLSCKECRRLKLKCDRIFPCQSCVKRGCASLCPEGALTSGRGSRFILANTEQLHDKITTLSDRVRDLEDALKSVQKSHPLLAPNLLHIKSDQDLYVTSSLAATQPPYKPIPESEFEAAAAAREDYYQGPSSDGVPDVPPDILQLSSTFPFPWSVDLKIRKRIRDSLPPQDEALRVCEQARKNALWQYHLDASETFLQNLLHHVYATPIENLSPRRLALLLMVLSIGSLVDLNRPLGSLYGEAYHHLARASVCEIPLMEEPDFDVLHALFFMVWWHLIFSDNKKAVGYAWNLIGFVAKLAQGLGLHRDNPRLRGIPEEDEKRRAVFWELLNLDARMSLSLGRPPSICLRHVDTKPPAFVGAGLYVPREEIIYHKWKNAFFIHCLTPILEAVAVVDPPPYSTIVELDALLRDFEIPEILDERLHEDGRADKDNEDTGWFGEYQNHTHKKTHGLGDADANDPSSQYCYQHHHHHHQEGTQHSGPLQRIPRFLAMQRALVSTSRGIATLQLHRKYFMEAMSHYYHDSSASAAAASYNPLEAQDDNNIASIPSSSSFSTGTGTSTPSPFSSSSSSTKKPTATDNAIESHPYAPSVLATCLGAASLIESIERLYDHEPDLSARFLYFWFNAYAAAAALALFVSRVPATPFAPEAQMNLERACRLFARAAEILPLCRRLFHATEKMADKSRQALKQHQQQQQQQYQATTSSAADAQCTCDNNNGVSKGGPGQLEEDPAIPVPTSFKGAHPSLVRRVVGYRQRSCPHLCKAGLGTFVPGPPGPAQLASWPPPASSSSSSGVGLAAAAKQQREEQERNERWLPDIYHYAHAGVNRELRYAFTFPASGAGGSSSSTTTPTTGTGSVTGTGTAGSASTSARGSSLSTSSSSASPPPLGSLLPSSSASFFNRDAGGANFSNIDVTATKQKTKKQKGVPAVTTSQAQPQPQSKVKVTPFVPGAPRVDQNEEFNFDFGALSLQCEETGYMAWF